MGVKEDSYVCPWPYYLRGNSKIRIMMPGERLAALLLLFDSKIPDMDSRVIEIIKVLDRRKMEMKKRDMERQIKRVVVQSLVDKYLEPLGMNVSFRLTEEGKVSMTLKRIYSAELEVSMEELADRLEDTEAILAQLKPAPTKREDFEDSLRII